MSDSSSSDSSSQEKVQLETLPLHLLLPSDSTQTFQTPHSLLTFRMHNYPSNPILSIKEDSRESLLLSLLQQEKSTQVAVPDLMVSAFIGTVHYLGKQGSNIKSMVGDYGVEIKVSNHLEHVNKSQDADMGGLSWRVIHVEGSAESRLEVLKKIIVLQRDGKDRLQPGQVQKSTAKFVFPEKAMGFMIGKGGFFVQELNQEYNVQVKVLPNELLLRDLRRSDNIVVIYGTMKNVIKACEKVLERMNEYYRKNDKSFSDYSLKMIIGAQFVSKLIGTRGELVREIARQSGASQIKILSEKETKSKECIIKVQGSLSNKLDATSIILNHLESFKSGIHVEKNDKKDRSRSRKRSRSNSRRRQQRKQSYEQRKNSQGSRKNSVSRQNSRRENEQRKESRKLSYNSESEDQTLFTQIISVKMMQKLIENDFFLFKKIQQESSCALEIKPTVLFLCQDKEQTLYLQIKGTLTNTKKAVNIIIDDILHLT